jgi:hypothetical protein
LDKAENKTEAKTPEILDSEKIEVEAVIETEKE